MEDGQFYEILYHFILLGCFVDITIVAVGKLKENYLLEGMADYAARLRRRHRLRLVEITDERVNENLSPAGQKAVLDKEGARILRAIPAGSFVTPLAIEGQPLRDDKFIHLLRGRPSLTFVIGGSLGLGEQVKARGDLAVSLSALTFPHQLVRMLLLEELCRALGS